jgi:hypothetical protein
MEFIVVRNKLAVQSDRQQAQRYHYLGGLLYPSSQVNTTILQNFMNTTQSMSTI